MAHEERIIAAIKEKFEMGYDKSQIEVTFGMVKTEEGYHLSKINGWGSTPITPILAANGEIKDNELISRLDTMGVSYSL